MVAEKSPEQVKDIVETFATSSADDWINVDKVPHFFIGILYGIRFGTILGGALLDLSISSMRSFERGQSSALALKGEAGIT
ncbi:hypothetical protein MKX03_029290 [Papaver bracteatum]|nr:hypothetical protein MKX03_029290 [Papaver bracteatum]